jgi:hypothetical protein
MMWKDATTINNHGSFDLVDLDKSNKHNSCIQRLAKRNRVMHHFVTIVKIKIGV